MAGGRADLGEAVGAHGVQTGPPVPQAGAGERGQARGQLLCQPLQELGVHAAGVVIRVLNPLERLLGVQPRDQLPSALVAK